MKIINYQNIQKILLILVSIAFVGGNLARFNLPPSIAFTLLDIFVLLLLTHWTIYKLKSKKSWNIGKIGIFIFAFVAIGLGSLFLNAQYLKTYQFFISLSYLFRWFLYASLFLVIHDSSGDVKKFAEKSLMIAGSGLVAVGFLQFVFFQNLSTWFVFHWDNHLYRIFSTFLDPNYTGAIYVITFLLFLSKLFLPINNSYNRIFISVMVGFSLLTLYLTYSRSSYIMAAVALIVFLFLRGFTKFIIPLLLIFGIGILIFSNPWIENRNLFRIASTVRRLESMQNAVVIFSDSPLFGIGFNAYRYAQNRYELKTNKWWETSHDIAGTENSFLFLLATTGIIGMSIYLLLWKRLLRASYTSKKPLRIVFISSVFGLFAHSIFVNSLFFTFIMCFIWILAALSIKENT